MQYFCSYLLLFDAFFILSDMESTFRALENNNYGFQVLVGKHNKKSSPMDYNNKENKIVTVPPRLTGIDYHSRTFQVSSKQQPRPMFQQNVLIEDQYINGLPSEVINEDAHQLEREGFYEPIKHNKFKYQTGRSYIL